MADTLKPLTGQTSSDKQRMFGALMALLRNHELGSDQLIPATVVTFDRQKNIATVKPLIQWVDVDDNAHDRNQFIGLNVLSLGGGGFHISFPLRQGDLGWIFAADRDISLFKQSLSNSRPNTGRLHKFEDGFFIPDVFRQYTINGADTNAMVIQANDSNTRISISNGVVNITAPTSVTVDSPLSTFTGNVHVEGNTTVDGTTDIGGVTTMHAAAAVGGTLGVSGKTTLSGGMTAPPGSSGGVTLPSDTTIGGVTVSGHGHISTNPGNRTSGGMIP